MSWSLCEGLEARRLFAAGDLDTQFGNAGQVTIDSIIGQWKAIATLPTGGFVVTGETDDKGDRALPVDIIAARYSANGALDTTFGVKGVAKIDLGADDSAQEVIVRSDGRIVIGAISGGDNVTVRLTSSGILDSSFGKAGILRGFAAQGMQSDGYLVGNSGTTIQRRSPRGVLDTAFATDGAFNLQPKSAHLRISSNVRILVQPDDKIIAADAVARPKFFDNAQLRVTRLTAAGVGDPTFASRGVFSLFTSFYDTVTASLSPGGSIFFTVDDASGSLAATLYTLNAGGGLDPSFQDHFQGEVVDLAFPKDGKVAAVLGYGVQRVLADGSPDNRFDAGDVLTLDYNASGLGNRIIVQDPGGDLLVAGFHYNEAGVSPVVYRVTSRDDGLPIQRTSHGTVSIFGTNKADQISATRTSTTFTFKINGFTRTYLRAHVRRIYVYGEAGDDQITLDGRRTSIFVDSGDGDDRVTILAGDAAGVLGAAGNDFISGVGLDPKFTGGMYASGGAGNDHILGSHFIDDLHGNSGNDTLEGDNRDGIDGGTGTNTFVLRH